jgi:hypothetical protein
LATAIAAGVTLAAGATGTATADEGDRFVGSSCQDVVSASSNTWRVCDDQYDSTSLPGYRSHIIVATPTNDCPYLTQTVRLRAATQSYYDGTTESIEAEADFCPELHLTVSGNSSSNVNVSLEHLGAGSPGYAVFSPS